MSVKELIREYQQTEKKDIAIKNLASKYGISERRVIEILENYNIDAPSILNRAEILDFDTHINKALDDIELEKDVFPAVSVVRQLSDMGWDDKKGIERVKALCFYVKTKLGVEPFDIFVRMLESIIENNGVETLENDLNSIKRGKIVIGIEQRVHESLLEMAKEMVDDLREPENVPEPESENEYRERIREAFKMINNVLGSVK